MGDREVEARLSEMERLLVALGEQILEVRAHLKQRQGTRPPARPTMPFLGPAPGLMEDPYQPREAEAVDSETIEAPVVSATPVPKSASRPRLSGSYAFVEPESSGGEVRERRRART